MNKLIDKIKGINILSEIENIDSNILFLAVVKSERYDLLKDNNIKLHIDNSDSSIQLIEYLLSDEDILYYIYHNGYSFSKQDIDLIFKIVCQKYQGTYKFDCFFNYFFNNKESLNNFIKENEDFFINYLHKERESIPYSLKECDNFVKLILQGNYIKLIGKLEKYSLSNLKLLVSTLKNKTDLPYYLGNDRFALHLFELKNDLEPDEFCELLNLLKDKSFYDQKTTNSSNSIFTNLVNDNIEYLINMASQTKYVPKCLVESKLFRDECIKRNRIDLAVQCILPNYIFQDDTLVRKYCNELNINLLDFYSRGKWVLDYYEKNNNIFNSLVATTLKDNIFNLGEEHIERFSNDTSIQIAIRNLNDIEFKILNKVLKKYTYKDYDISFMVNNILNNIHDYSELINSLDLSSITDEEVKLLISVMQVSKNPYNITNITDLKDYRNKKKEFFEKNYRDDDINFNKDNLLKLIFNITLNQAITINNQFCYDRNKNVLQELSNSELPKNILEYLKIINIIVESPNNEDIKNTYNQYKETNVYNKELPLETYLRSEYTKLYSDSLYRIEERESIYGQKDSIHQNISYNGKNIQVCIPREKFNFLVHCIGSCSKASDIIDTNYQKNWENRPQLQDHFIACSYINDKGIYSVRSRGSIILGFNFLENSALYGMGDTDIDSIGFYAKLYNPSKELMEGNGNRAHYFTPTLLVKSINDGYNEIVIERRNYSIHKKEHFKRYPDYIIMMSESLEQSNFTYLNNLYNEELSFISNEDRKLIKRTNNEREIKQILLKYKDIITKKANIQNIKSKDMLDIYVSSIIKSKYFEDCLKASSEFDIPLVVIDKEYYFNKMLFESGIYDEKTISDISLSYLNSDESKKRKIFNMVAKKMDLTEILEQSETTNFTISL